MKSSKNNSDREYWCKRVNERMKDFDEACRFGEALYSRVGEERAPDMLGMTRSAGIYAIARKSYIFLTGHAGLGLNEEVQPEFNLKPDPISDDDFLQDMDVPFPR